MNAVLAMDSRDADPRPRADRLDGRIRDAMAITERQTGVFPVIGHVVFCHSAAEGKDHPVVS